MVKEVTVRFTSSSRCSFVSTIENSFVKFVRLLNRGTWEWHTICLYSLFLLKTRWLCTFDCFISCIKSNERGQWSTPPSLIIIWLSTILNHSRDRFYFSCSLLNKSDFTIYGFHMVSAGYKIACWLLWRLFFFDVTGIILMSDGWPLLCWITYSWAAFLLLDILIVFAAIFIRSRLKSNLSPFNFFLIIVFFNTIKWTI